MPVAMMPASDSTAWSSAMTPTFRQIDGVAIGQQAFRPPCPSALQARRALYRGQIRGRAARLQHHVVRDVHQRRDRALAPIFRALAHPRGVDALR